MSFSKLSHASWLVSCGFLGALPALAVVENLPVDGSLRDLNSEAIEAPYSQDEYYAYANSPSFARWVYSPWTTPSFTAETGIEVTKTEVQDRKSILVSEFNIKTSHLDPTKSYKILLEKDYGCGSAAGTEELCTLAFTVRCYGKTETEDWGITYEATTRNNVALGEGVFKIDDTSFPMDKCGSYVYVAAESTVSPQVDKFTFKGLRVGLLDETATTP